MIIIDGVPLDDGTDPHPNEMDDFEDEESGNLNAELSDRKEATNV